MRICIDKNNYNHKYRCRVRDKNKRINHHIGFFDTADEAYKEALKFIKKE